MAGSSRKFACGVEITAGSSPNFGGTVIFTTRPVSSSNSIRCSVPQRNPGSVLWNSSKVWSEFLRILSSPARACACWASYAARSGRLRPAPCLLSPQTSRSRSRKASSECLPSPWLALAAFEAVFFRCSRLVEDTMPVSGRQRSFGDRKSLESFRRPPPASRVLQNSPNEFTQPSEPRRIGFRQTVFPCAHRVCDDAEFSPERVLTESLNTSGHQNQIGGSSAILRHRVGT